MRETLAQLGLPCNRRRIHDEEQLAVEFRDYNDASAYADDFFMGWLIAASKRDRERLLKEIEEAHGEEKKENFTFKRDSILRINLAVATEPYRYDTVFTQSPQMFGPWKNAENSQLLHREVSYTAYQFPFAINLEDCRPQPEWTRVLLQAMGQNNNVAGNHARSYFDMSPASMVVRLTPRLAAGYDTYGFRVDEQDQHRFPEVMEGIIHGDLPGDEFYLGGRLIKGLDEATIGELEKRGANLYRDCQKLLDELSDRVVEYLTSPKGE